WYNVIASRSIAVREDLAGGVAAATGSASLLASSRSPIESLRMESNPLSVKSGFSTIMLPLTWSARSGRCIQLLHVFLDHALGAKAGSNGLDAFFNNVQPAARNAIKIALIEQRNNF